MPSKIYQESWQDTNKWLHHNAPDEANNNIKEAIDIMEKAIERRDVEIKFLYSLIEKYLTCLPTQAQQELLDHGIKSAAVSNMFNI